MNLERFVTPRLMIALMVIGFAALLGALMISDAVNDPYVVREIGTGDRTEYLQHLIEMRQDGASIEEMQEYARKYNAGGGS